MNSLIVAINPNFSNLKLLFEILFYCTFYFKNMELRGNAVLEEKLICH